MLGKCSGERAGRGPDGLLARVTTQGTPDRQSKPLGCCFSFSFLFFFLRAARGRSQARGQIGTATATAMQDMSCLCDLHHSSGQRHMLNPLNKATEGTSILTDTSRVLNALSHNRFQSNSLKHITRGRQSEMHSSQEMREKGAGSPTD